MNRSLDVLFERMLLLSGEQLAKVEQFVESLHRGRDHVKLLASVSEAAFAAVWNNPEDDVYDGL